MFITQGNQGKQVDRNADLLTVYMFIQSLEVSYLVGLKAILSLPCGSNPLTKGSASLLVVLQLRQIGFQINKSEEEKERRTSQQHTILIISKLTERAFDW